MMYTGVMGPILEGFNNELTKLATKPLSQFEKDQRKMERDVLRVQKKLSKGNHPFDRLRGESSPRQRDYLASALIASAAYPGVRLGTSAVGRALRNRSLRKAITGASRKQRKRLSKRIESGPAVVTHASGKKGLATREHLMTDAARGAMVGSIVQMVRDRFSGSTAVK